MAREVGKIVLERTYTIPLSRELLKVPGYKKAKKAIRTIQAFMRKHMKSETVLIGQHLNMKVWENGIKNPPKNIKVTTTKDDKGTVMVELFGAPKDEPKKESKVKAKSTKNTVDVEAKTIDEKANPKEEQIEKAIAQEKEEIQELAKELPKKQHHAQKQAKDHQPVVQHQQAPKHE